jgi:hypothetical protein
MTRKSDDQYSDEAAQRRFEAALRGEREVGHEPMKSLPKKRQSTKKKVKSNAHTWRSSASANEGIFAPAS